MPWRAGLPEFAIRVKDVDQAGAGVAQAPADCLAGLAKVLGDLLIVEPVGDPLHDLPLCLGQLAEDAPYPLLAFPRAEPGVYLALARPDVAALDEAPGYPGGPAGLVLDEVMDDRRPRVP